MKSQPVIQPSRYQQAMTRVYADMQAQQTLQAHQQQLAIRYGQTHQADSHTFHTVVITHKATQLQDRHSSGLSLSKLKENTRLYLQHLRNLDKEHGRMTVFAALSPKAKQLWQNLLKGTQKQARKKEAALARAQSESSSPESTFALPMLSLLG